MLRFFFNPAGRIDRRSYVLGVLAVMLLAIIGTTLARWERDFTGSGILLNGLWAGAFGDYGRGLDVILERSLASLILVLGIHGLAAWSFVVLTARRLHDMGRPGLYAAIGLLIGAGPLVLVFAILPGDRGQNVYDRPKTGHVRQGTDVVTA